MLPVNERCQAELIEGADWLDGAMDNMFWFRRREGVKHLTFTVMAHGAGTQTSALFSLNAARSSFKCGPKGDFKIDFSMYCDVGDRGTECEWPDTINYMHKLHWYWSEPLIHVRPSTWYSRLISRDWGDTERDDGHPVSGLYDCYHKNETMPVRVFRGCTGDFKVKPQLNYLKAIRDCAVSNGIDLSFRQILGYSADEAKRAKRYDSGYSWITGYFPLIEWGWNRQDTLDALLKYCSQMVASIGLPEKSGCWFCPFQKRGKYDPVTLEPTPRSWLALKDQHPELLEKAFDMEDRQNVRRVASGKKPIYLYGEKELAYWVRPQNIQTGFDFDLDEGDGKGDDTCESGYCFY